MIARHHFTAAIRVAQAMNENIATALQLGGYGVTRA
jgi:hypothetical protein